MRPNKLGTAPRREADTGHPRDEPLAHGDRGPGQARQYDYVEFLAEYSPSDLHDLDQSVPGGRAGRPDAHHQDRPGRLRLRGAAGHRRRIPRRAVHRLPLGRGGPALRPDRPPETPQDGGLFGAAPRRFTRGRRSGGPNTSRRFGMWW